MEEIIDEQRRSGLTYEQELELLANVYRLALESYRKKKAAERAQLNGHDDTEGRSDGFRTAKSIMPK